MRLAGLRVPSVLWVRASRGSAVLLRLARLVPPRVVAAVFRTWFNGWCTARWGPAYLALRFRLRYGGRRCGPQYRVSPTTPTLSTSASASHGADFRGIAALFFCSQAFTSFQM